MCAVLTIVLSLHAVAAQSRAVRVAVRASGGGSDEADVARIVRGCVDGGVPGAGGGGAYGVAAGRGDSKARVHTSGADALTVV